MHAHFLDPYVFCSSPIHDLDARLKLVLALGFIFTTALVPAGAWAAYVLLLAIVLSVEILSALGVRYVLKRAVLALPFVLAALPVIFTVKGTPWFDFSLGSWQLTASIEGVERFAGVALKSWISVQMAIVLAASTPFPDLLLAMRAVRVPRLLVTVFGLMWRYLFVLVDEAMRLLRARSARSGVSEDRRLKPGGSLVWRARVAGGMAGSLMLRAFERSDRIYMAMVSRGYDGEVRSAPLRPLNGTHWLILAGGLGIYALVLALAYLL